MEEKSGTINPVGLYHDPASGQYLGALDDIQADAMVQQGWKLHTAGTDAAMTKQDDLEALIALDRGEPVPAAASDSNSDDASDNAKKGKK